MLIKNKATFFPFFREILFAHKRFHSTGELLFLDSSQGCSYKLAEKLLLLFFCNGIFLLGHLLWLFRIWRLNWRRKVTSWIITAYSDLSRRTEACHPVKTRVAGHRITYHTVHSQLPQGNAKKENHTLLRIRTSKLDYLSDFINFYSILYLLQKKFIAYAFGCNISIKFVSWIMANLLQR